MRRRRRDAGTGGYGTVFYLSTNAKGCNTTAIWRAYKRGALFANPCYTQIHPTCIPVTGDHQSKLTLMSESLRNDGRIWVPVAAGRQPLAGPDPRGRTRLLPGAQVPELRQPGAPRHRLPRRQGGLRRGPRRRPGGRGVYLDFADAIGRLGVGSIRERYGNLFDMYERITDEDPYKVPMRIYPAIHYTMGGLWVDYNLMSNIPGLFVLGEANFSDHGANRLGASALMQGLADGYFVIPYTLGNYLASEKPGAGRHRAPAFTGLEAAVHERTSQLLAIKGKRTVDEFHRELGKMMWDHCGMARNAEGLNKLLDQLPTLREEFWHDVSVPGGGAGAQPVAREGRPRRRLPGARRAAGDRRPGPPGVVRRPLPRGVPDPGGRGPARRRALRLRRRLGVGGREGPLRPRHHRALPTPVLHKEPLEFDYVHLSQRSYK